jgi:transposase
MTPELWGLIHRLHEVEKLSQREIIRQLRCSWHTVSAALASPERVPVAQRNRSSKLDAHQERIATLLAKYPSLSAVRIAEELRKHGYTGKLSILRTYLRSRRSGGSRVYHEVLWEPGEAMQVDWGSCGRVRIGETWRRVSVFVAVLCYSRLIYICFSLDEKKESFYRGIVEALAFFGGSPRKIISDNLKAAVVDGHGPTARFHPEYHQLCGLYRMEPIACWRKDPESKGMVESGVRYVKGNALAGRTLETWDDYQALAPTWRDDANRRQHRTTGQQPVEMLRQEGLRALPERPFDTTRVVPAVVTSHARVRFDGNRYSVPPEVVGKAITIKASEAWIQIIHGEHEVARHPRSWEKKQRLVLPEHRVAVLAKRRRESAGQIEARFDALGSQGEAFRKGLAKAPVKAAVHMKAILKMAQLYGGVDVAQALEAACRMQVFDKAYVLNLIEQQRRKAALPTPIPMKTVRQDVLDATEYALPDPGWYDQILKRTGGTA